MAARFEVTLDEELQIIRQSVDGHVELEDFQEIRLLTEDCATRLRNPKDVRILVSGPALGLSSVRARRAMVDSLRRPSLTRLAVYGANPIGRVMLRFLAIAAGVNHARGFATEEQAIAWLLA
jgi:hypothetical protein